MDQPGVRRRVEAARQVYAEARRMAEARLDELEGDLQALLAQLQARAQKAQRQIERAQSAADHYAVLGLRPGATLDEVKGAWRQRMRENHPDRFAHDPQAEAAALDRAQTINVAYQELSALLTGKENRAVD